MEIRLARSGGALACDDPGGAARTGRRRIVFGNSDHHLLFWRDL
jgi:hypothetical protein